MFKRGDIVQIIGIDGHYIPMGMEARIKHYYDVSSQRDVPVCLLSTDCGHEQLVKINDFVLLRPSVENNESAIRFLKRSDSGA